MAKHKSEQQEALKIKTDFTRYYTPKKNYPPQYELSNEEYRLYKSKVDDAYEKTLSNYTVWKKVPSKQCMLDIGGCAANANGCTMSSCTSVQGKKLKSLLWRSIVELNGSRNVQVKIPIQLKKDYKKFTETAPLKVLNSWAFQVVKSYTEPVVNWPVVKASYESTFEHNVNRIPYMLGGVGANLNKLDPSNATGYRPNYLSLSEQYISISKDSYFFESTGYSGPSYSEYLQNAIQRTSDHVEKTFDNAAKTTGQTELEYQKNRTRHMQNENKMLDRIWKR